MKILLVTGSFPPMRCGVGDYTHLLVNELATRGGVQVGVLTSQSVRATEPAENFQLFPVVASWRLRELGRIFTVIRDWRPDIVHVQTPTQGYGNSWVPRILPLICRVAGFRVVQTWHEYIGQLGPRQLLWLLLQAPVAGGLIVVRPDYDQVTRGLLRVAFTRKVRRFIPNASVIPRAELSEQERAFIRNKVSRSGARLIVYFGFMHAAKGVEQVFQVADSARDHIVIVGEFRDSDPYHRHIRSIIDSNAWFGKTTLMGFLAAAEAARVIAVADAVVLPFAGGGGEWNTSIHGAQAQGTFVLTTSQPRRGYSAPENTYYASPGDIAEMRAALEQYGGHRSEGASSLLQNWTAIGDAHLELYRLTAAQ